MQTLLIRAQKHHTESLPSAVSSWSPSDVHTWLCSKGYLAEATLFRMSTIHGVALLAMNRDALNDMGITSVDLQSHLLGEIRVLKHLNVSLKHNFKSRVFFSLCLSLFSLLFFIHQWFVCFYFQPPATAICFS
jgi:hypothetical protein